MVIEFHKEFAKQCKGKLSTKFKIQIKGVPYSSIQKHISIYDGFKINNSTLHMITNRKCTIIKSDGKYHCLINLFFNDKNEYIYSDLADDIEFTCYDNEFIWKFNQSQSLILSGKLKYRAPNGPWIKTE